MKSGPSTLSSSHHQHHPHHHPHHHTTTSNGGPGGGAGGGAGGAGGEEEELERSTIEANPITITFPLMEESKHQSMTHSQHHSQLQYMHQYDISISRRSCSTQIGIRVEREVGKLTRQCRMLGGDEETKVSDATPEQAMDEALTGVEIGQSSSSSSDDDPVEVPLFDRSEIMAWTLLGNGAFSEVYQVWGFKLAAGDEHTPAAVLENPLQEKARQRIKDTAMDDQNRSNYVLKHLRNDLFDKSDKSRFVHAASDLVMEALFLSKLDHPNIIKLRGTSHGIEQFGDGEHDGFFLLLDRLDCTLSDKIQMWGRSTKCRQRIYSRHLYDYQEKIDIGLQIARGLDYLHDRDIIFRDLKPDNIGVRNGVVKIFDFGLCREMPEECPVENKVFHMSGVGTRRYMAPEIFLTQHYNLKVDVYSFTIVLHCMLSLARPFEKYNAHLHTLLVCKEGVRPPIPHEWPREVKDLLRYGWAHKPSDRPTMKEARQSLERLAVKVAEAAPEPSSVGSPRGAHHKGSSSANVNVMPTLLESSLQFVDAMTSHVCQAETVTKAGNALRAIEMQMIEGGLTPSMLAAGRGQAFNQNPEYPHYRHLRSSYL